jgi:hypothetical protein
MPIASVLPAGEQPVRADDLSQLLRDTAVSTDVSKTALADRMDAAEADVVALQAAAGSGAVSILQTSGDGTYTGTIDLPAFATLVGLHLEYAAKWTGTGADLTIDDGTTTFVDAHDLTGDTDGDAEDIDLSAASGRYDSGARTLTVSVVQTGTGTAGVTRVLATWVAQTAQAATKV